MEDFTHRSDVAHGVLDEQRPLIRVRFGGVSADFVVLRCRFRETLNKRLAAFVFRVVGGHAKHFAQCRQRPG
nr:MAG: hypothetical protein [Bacteriophage sp.]